MTPTKASSIQIKAVNPVEYIEETTRLVKEDWSELERDFSERPPAVNADIYQAMYDSNMLICLGVFDGDSVVGYSIAFIYRHLHYAIQVAQTDALFLAKNYRKGSLGLRLMRETEQAAKAAGCKRMIWTAKPNSTLHNVLERKGYALGDLLYFREV